LKEVFIPLSISGGAGTKEWVGDGSCESIEEKSGIPFGCLRAWPPGV